LLTFTRPTQRVAAGAHAADGVTVHYSIDQALVKERQLIDGQLVRGRGHARTASMLSACWMLRCAIYVLCAIDPYRAIRTSQSLAWHPFPCWYHFTTVSCRPLQAAHDRLRCETKFDIQRKAIRMLERKLSETASSNRRRLSH